ncbi:polysaccharide deacetylase family protein [Paenibacillus sp. CAU 1782]
MKRPWRYFCLALLMLQLAGCSAAGGDASEGAEAGNRLPVASAEASPTLPEQTTDAPATPATDESAAASAVPTESAAPIAAEPAGEQTNAAPLYAMTETYRFAPLQKDTPSQVVLLTFDDGPKDEAVLTKLLDVLDSHGAKAIFFVNGYRVKQNPELLKLIHERGQAIGNHSYDHINLKKENLETVQKQIGEVQTMVEDLIGVKPLFFRPPYGSGSDEVRETAKNHGMLYMTWSNGSLDWDSSAKNKPEVVVANVLDQLHPGANILMHELSWTADALDTLLTELEDRDYGFIDPADIETAAK